MSKLAADVGAINLSQGFPDFDCDPALVEAVARHMREGRNQYAPMQGVLALREAIAAKYEHFHGRRYDPEREITVTSGGTEAIFDAVAAVVRAGDEVIVLEPCYDSYVPAIELSGGIPVVVSMHLPTTRVTGTRCVQAVTPRTRLHHLQLAAQSRPAPSWTAGRHRELSSIVLGTDILIVSDEVYEHIIFDGAQHESLARHDELAARSFIVGSFGKTYHITGWKVGYAVAPAALTAEFRKVHQFVTFSTNTPVHIRSPISSPTHAGSGAVALLPGEARLFLRLMDGSRFSALPCRGSYFQLMDYSAISTKTIGLRDADDEGIRRRLDPDVTVPAQPKAPQVVRFCFAKKDETLESAAARLRLV